MLTASYVLSIALMVQTATGVAWNECATCHLQLVWTQSGITHVDEWVTSAHASYRVGCEQCHGGDPKTSDRVAAHRGVLNSADASSSTHRTALTRTCGRCHTPEANAFARSMHRGLLSQGDPAAPTCTSCHTSMATDVPSPSLLEQRCLDCHRNDPQDRAQLARRQLQDIAALGADLKRAKFQIAGVLNDDRRNGLTARWTAADASLRIVVAGLHAFDQRLVDNRLNDVRAQLAGLRTQLER
jgi:hypothetical protein